MLLLDISAALRIFCSSVFVVSTQNAFINCMRFYHRISFLSPNPPHAESWTTFHSLPALSLEAVIVHVPVHRVVFNSFCLRRAARDCAVTSAGAMNTQTWVDCHAKRFEDVPHGLPHGTWLLDLGGNKLREIRSRAFTGLWSLRILVLSDSSIQALQTQVRSLIPDVHNPVIYLPCKVSSSKYHLNQLFKGIVHLKNINICWKEFVISSSEQIWRNLK